MPRISLSFGASDLMLPIIPSKRQNKLGYDMPYALSHADTDPIHIFWIIDCSIRLSTLTPYLPKSNHSKVTPVPKFLSPIFFGRVQPMLTKAGAGRSLRVFAEDVGVPNYIVVSGTKEQKVPNSAFMQTVRQLKMNIRNTEPYSPLQNRCETTIGILKKIRKQTIARKNVHQ